MSTPDPQVRVFDDPTRVALAAAEEFARRTQRKAEAGGDFAVALSGGSTPQRLYALLAEPPYRDRVPWDRVHLFWGDERAVPPEHPDSNYGAARAALLERVPIPAGNIHRMEAENPDPQAAAAAYERTLRGFLGLSAAGLPRFDLVILGMGADGHTASLFPGSEALWERRRLVVAPWVDALGSWRLTLTCPVLKNAACIMFLVTGPEKAETLRRVLENDQAAADLPARLVAPRDGELLWLVDRAAAAGLGH